MGSVLGTIIVQIIQNLRSICLADHQENAAGYPIGEIEPSVEKWPDCRFSNFKKKVKMLVLQTKDKFDYSEILKDCLHAHILSRNLRY